MIKIFKIRLYQVHCYRIYHWYDTQRNVTFQINTRSMAITIEEVKKSVTTPP